MEDILKNMDEERKYRLINSALEEFSINTFEKASTNNIVKRAEISKGLLYHYFSTKQALFEYLEVFVFQKMMEEIKNDLDWNDGDIFNRLKQVVLIKMRVINEYPYLIEFSKGVFNNKSTEELKKIMTEHMPNFYTKFYSENIDFTLFKEGLDIPKVINIVEWTLEKFAEKQKVIWCNSDKLDYDKICKQFDEYIIILKQAFYK